MVEQLQTVNWQEYWLNFEEGTTPTSTQLHPEFEELLKPEHLVLDVGCCSGRIALRLIDRVGCSVVGIDINPKELALAARGPGTSERAGFIQASAVAMPIKNNRLDAAVLLGVMGGINPSYQAQVLKETVRVVRPNGLMYISEIERFPDDNEHWKATYDVSAQQTGEFGSVVVPDYTKSERPVKFIAYHFTEEQLVAALIQNGVRNTQVRRLAVDTRDASGFGDLYNNLCVWGMVDE